MNFPPSLVKYSTPVLISTGVKKQLKEPKGEAKPPNYFDKKESEADKTLDMWRWIEEMEKGGTIEEILNTIIPPREYSLESQGQVWIQTAISVPATRNEVVQLQGIIP